MFFQMPLSPLRGSALYPTQPSVPLVPRFTLGYIMPSTPWTVCEIQPLSKYDTIIIDIYHLYLSIEDVYSPM